MGTGTRGHSGGAMKKLIDEVQGIGRSSRHVPALRRLSLRKQDALLTDITDLGLDDANGSIDWPQICVVGGQSEGKSTLLSAIVSSKLGMKMKFLPEGQGNPRPPPECLCHPPKDSAGCSQGW